MSSATTYENLLERCAGGDEAAFRELYERTSAQLFGIVLRILRRKEVAEDALQDVYVSIWQNAAQYRPSRGAPLTWMISIARYRAIDARRRVRPEITIESGEGDLELATGTADPVVEADRSAARLALERCLALLSAEQRRCVSLAFLNGYTHPEIAAATQSPLGSVKSWVRRGLQALKECLGR